MKRHFVLTVAATAVAAMMIPQASAKELVIGLSFGKTGRFATIGSTTEVSVDIAVREINAAGGVNGMKLRVVKFDTAGDPKQAVVAVRKFARDDNALAVVGPLSSAEARVAFPAGERLGIVQMPNASSAPKLADRFSYGYRIGESEARQFIRVVNTLKKKGMLKKSTVVLYGTDDFISKVVGLKIMVPIFKKFGVKMASSPIGFRTEAFDLGPQVTQLKNMKLDYIAFAGITPVAIRFLKELRKRGVKSPLIGSTIWADPAIIKGMGKDADGSVFAIGFWHKRDTRAIAFSRKFVAGAKKLGIDKPFPHQADAAAYDAVYILAAAMKKAKVTGDRSKLKAERTAIRDGLRSIKVSGVMGNICFNKNGDSQLPGYVLTMKNAQWHLLEAHKPLPCK